MRWRRVVYGRRRRRRRSSSEGGGFIVLAVLAFASLSYVASYVGWVAVVAALVVATVLIVWFSIRRATLSTPKAQDLYLGLQNVGAMTGGQFEVFMAQVLRALGYSTTVFGGSGDQGVDIIAVAKDGKVAVQCKNYKKRVGNKPVQEVYAGSRHHRCDHAWVIAPAGYTKGAHDLAQSVGVLLFDADSIRKWIKRIDEAEKQAMEQRHPT